MAGDSIRVICGPTAAGKSALALALAERYHASIISADSRQVYRRFDIGTAKPSAEERARVPHFGIDVVAPEMRYSAAAWADACAEWITASRSMGREPLIVGGTGFYLRALFAPLFESPVLDGHRRARLAGVLERLPVAELRRWCERLDPGRAHLGRTQLLRSIETVLLTGSRLSDLHATAARAPRFVARYLVVDPGAALAARVTRRVDDMLDGGWADEVRRLAASVPADAPAWKATGYTAVRRLASGEAGREATRSAVIIATRQYAKRQRTWFRHQLGGTSTHRVDPSHPSVLDVASSWWEREGHDA